MPSNQHVFEFVHELSLDRDYAQYLRVCGRALERRAVARLADLRALGAHQLHLAGATSIAKTAHRDPPTLDS